jgi:FixJ family two-component response regulator
MSSAAVHMIEDDPDIGNTIADLLKLRGYAVQTHKSAAEFVIQQLPPGPACLILDLKMPEIGRLDLQGVLAMGNGHLPIVFVSGQDVVNSVRANKVNFLTKRVREKELFAAVEAALERSVAARSEFEALKRDREAFAKLTPRERQVCLLIARGLLNKQVGFELGTTEKTVKVQRARVLKKFGAYSLADVVRSVERLRAAGVIPYTDSTDPAIYSQDPVLAFHSVENATKYQPRNAA